MYPHRGGKTIKRSTEMMITEVEVGCDPGERRKLLRCGRVLGLVWVVVFTSGFIKLYLRVYAPYFMSVHFVIKDFKLLFTFLLYLLIGVSFSEVTHL